MENKNIEYIIKYNEKVSDYEHYDEGKEKSFFKIKDVYDNVLLEQKDEDILFFSEFEEFGPKNKKREESLKLGLFSNLINYINVYLYNDVDLMKKNPSMFFTENILFINANFLKQINSSMKDIDNEKINEFIIPILIIVGMIKIIEKETETTFTLEEKSSIIKETLSNIMNEKEINIAIQFINLEILDKEIIYNNLSNLISYVQKEEFSEHTIKVLNSKNNYTGFINNILFNSRELKDINNPLSKLTTIIKEPTIEIEIIDYSLDSFKNVYSLGNNSQKTELIIYSLIKQHQKILLNTYKENNDFIETKKELNDWVKYIMALTDHHFVYILGQFRKDAKELYDDKLMYSLITALLDQMSKHENFDNIKRSLAINVASGYSSMRKKTKIEAIKKDIYEKQEKYIKACEVGDLETIKALLNNKDKNENIDINTKGAFNIAADKNQIEVMNYLLMSDDLPENIKINEKIINLISSKEVINKLIMEKYLEDEDLVLHYDLLLKKVCQTHDMDSINYLLSINKENQDISKMLYQIFYDMTGAQGLEIMNMLNEKIKETSIDENDYFEKIRLTFVGAISSQKIDIVKFFIFDNNVPRLDENRIVEEGYATTQGEILNTFVEVRGLFDLRDLNGKLNNDLPVEEKSVNRKKM